MVFCGISRDYSVTGDGQYETIGRFWEEMSRLYGMENLMGLGYHWENDTLSYAIGLKEGEIRGWNVRIPLPDAGWVTVTGETERLKEVYEEIYKGGSLRFEIETFYENGSCEIRCYREISL